MHRMTKWFLALLIVALLGCTAAVAEESHYLELPTNNVKVSKKITEIGRAHV